MSQKIKILFPIDFTEQSEKAFPIAQFIAKTYDAEMFILHTLSPPSGPMKLFVSFDEVEARKKALSMMDDFIKERGDSSLIFNKMVKVGKPAKKLVEAAFELDANAIVMGTHGATGMEELFIGTNAAKVISTAPCPVITLREKPDHLAFKKILLPLDLSRETGEKFELGIEFAENFGSELVVLAVLTSQSEEDKKRIHKRVNMAVERIQQHNVPVSSAMIQAKGSAADQVISYASEIGADLICVMTQQAEKDIKESFLGSDAVHVVNHSAIPVFSIKPKREYKTKSVESGLFT